MKKYTKSNQVLRYFFVMFLFQSGIILENNALSLVNITFTPYGNWNSSTSGYDGTPYAISNAAVNITVAPVNDAPSFVKGADQTVNEDCGPQTVNGWATALSTGPANEIDQTLSFALSNDNTNLFSVQPSIDPTGKLTYAPAPDANGIATVSVILSDNGGTANGGSDTYPPQTFTITVNPVNDAPSFVKGADQTVKEDCGPQTVNSWATSLSTGPANESNQTLSFTLSNDNTGLFSVRPSIDPSGNLTYTPATDINGMATVSVVLKDNGGTVNGGVDTYAAQTFTITVNPLNNYCWCVGDITKSGPENTDILFSATDFTSRLNDIDVDALTKIKVVTLPVNGILKLSGTAIIANQEIDTTALRGITFTPSAYWNGTTSFMWNGNDGNIYAANNALVKMIINPVNYAPVINAKPITTPEDTPVSGTVTATDPDNDPLTFSKTTDPFHGTITINPEGTYTYIPNTHYIGNDSFMVTVSDGNGGIDSGTVFITVTWVNDKPTAVDKHLWTRENTPLNGDLTKNSTPSRDGNNVWYTAANPGQGKVTVFEDGSFSYVPNLKYVGQDSFTYAIRDTNGDASMGTVIIDVLPMPEVIKRSSNPVRHNDGTFSWVYTITLINGTNRKVDSLQVVDNLDDVFAPKGCTYKISGISASGQLTANGIYNGSSIVNLLVEGSTMVINSRDSIMFEVRVDTHGQLDTVSVTNQALCSGKDSFGTFNLSSNPDQTNIPGVNLFIPDAFSPNGDGINDNFVIIHSVSLRIEIEIYNRWGNLVFKSADYQNNWDGRGMGNFLGQELPEGTYFCSCKVISINNGTVVNNGVKYVTLRR